MRGTAHPRLRLLGLFWLAILLMMPCAARAAPPQVPVEAGIPVDDLRALVPNRQGGFREERVTAVLFEPPAGATRAGAKWPAAVIINSSGGVLPHTELFWGRLLAAHGIAALVVDSFTPRGVVRTSDDQTRMVQSQSNADAVADFRWLARQPRVDAGRIMVMGMSKGGAAAVMLAFAGHLKWLGAGEIRFAAHVALTPGGYNIPFRSVRSTGRPIFFMLADLDEATPATPCIELAERMKAAGPSQITRAIYPDDHHAMEWAGGGVTTLRARTSAAAAASTRATASSAWVIHHSAFRRTRSGPGSTGTASPAATWLAATRG